MGNKEWVSLAVILFLGTSLSFFQASILYLALWCMFGKGLQILYVMSRTIKRDLRLLKRGIRVLYDSFKVKLRNQTVPEKFRQVVDQYPNKVMFINSTTGAEWTFKEVETHSNRIANFMLSKGFKKGDSVALFMENRPEFACILLGLSKIGVVPALINYSLRDVSLVNTIKVAGCKAIIYGLELEEAVIDIVPELKKENPSFSFFYSYSGNGSTNINKKLDEAIHFDDGVRRSDEFPEPDEIRKSIKVTDCLMFIYTSGTTGLPKAVNITHIRHLFICIAVHHIIGLSPDDIIYCYLPMYHSSGGQIGLASSLIFGSTTVIKKKFSASMFWKDCANFNVTATQYIGEICKYLLATPVVPEEKSHKVKIMFGNGLRAQIWKEFVDRFNIKNIAEFYGATEGNSNIINIENKIGAVGFTAPWAPHFLHELLLPLYLIKVDRDSGEPIRNSEGFCIPCEPNEPGEFIGKIVRGDPVKDFQGYRDDNATKKKVLCNVFKQGDIYFRSGDLLVQDEFGWLYFRDRLGDTFRWRGENVSTLEVEAIISNIIGRADATVYGVEIPGCDGRAGMVVIVAQNQEESNLQNILSELQDGASRKLPAYARPIFVRFVQVVDLTGTYKLKKVNLQSEGYDPSKTKDPLYVMIGSKYEKITTDVFHRITSGDIRF